MNRDASRGQQVLEVNGRVAGARPEEQMPRLRDRAYSAPALAVGGGGWGWQGIQTHCSQILLLTGSWKPILFFFFKKSIF